MSDARKARRVRSTLKERELAEVRYLRTLRKPFWYGPEKRGLKPMHEIDRQVLRYFDLGLIKHEPGIGGRDWEWDWSLSGPISVTFRGRAARPGQRK